MLIYRMPVVSNMELSDAAESSLTNPYSKQRIFIKYSPFGGRSPSYGPDPACFAKFAIESFVLRQECDEASRWPQARGD
jgi:hypothetical protein